MDCAAESVFRPRRYLVWIQNFAYPHQEAMRGGFQERLRKGSSSANSSSVNFPQSKGVLTAHQ